MSALVSNTYDIFSSKGRCAKVVQIIYIYIHFHELKYDIESSLGVGLVHVKIHPFYIICIVFLVSVFLNIRGYLGSVSSVSYHN